MPISDNPPDSVVIVETGVQGPQGATGATGATGPTGPTMSGTVTGVDSISTLDYIQFDTTNTTAPAVAGRLAWNGTDGTLDLYLKDGSVTLQVGQEEVIRVTNRTGSTIAEGAAVYVSGAQGQRLKVALADASSDSTTVTTLGIVTSTGGIANNGEGYVTVSGLVRGLNTSTYSDGDVLWLSETAGQYSATRPAAPAHGVQIGYVVVASNNGSIYVHVQNGYELNELHDVNITNPQNGQALIYRNGIWVNEAI